MENDKQTVVWDLLVRICHWALVIGVALAFFTAEDFPETHEIVGVAIAVIVVVRVLWGLIGSRHARFSDFVYRPDKVGAYLGNLFFLRGRRYLGHSPAGGAMVVAILLTLTVTVATGLATEFSVPEPSPAAGITSAGVETSAAATARAVREENESFIGQIHEASTNVLLVLIGLHIAGVLLASFAHRENLVTAMFTGRKRS